MVKDVKGFLPLTLIGQLSSTFCPPNPFTCPAMEIIDEFRSTSSRSSHYSFDYNQTATDNDKKVSKTYSII